LSWHTLATRDGNGFVVPADLYDGIHPTLALGFRTGLALADFLDERVGQAPFSPPPAGSPLWLTASPYVADSDGQGKDPAWNPQWGSTGNRYEKFTDLQGLTWQQCSSTQGGENGMHNIYAASPFGGTTQALVGKRIRGAARIELPPGNTLKGAMLWAHCQDSSYMDVRTRYALYADDSVVQLSGDALQAFTGLFLTEEFVVPAETHWIRLEIRWWGEGTLRFRQAGIFQVPTTPWAEREKAVESCRLNAE
jgi:hypothetical protein